MKRDLEEARRYRDRADALRSKVSEFSQANRQTMLAIAADYDRMADTLERIAESLGGVESLTRGLAASTSTLG